MWKYLGNSLKAVAGNNEARHRMVRDNIGRHLYAIAQEDIYPGQAGAYDDKRQKLFANDLAMLLHIAEKGCANARISLAVLKGMHWQVQSNLVSLRMRVLASMSNENLVSLLRSPAELNAFIDSLSVQWDVSGMVANRVCPCAIEVSDAIKKEENFDEFSVYYFLSATFRDAIKPQEWKATSPANLIEICRRRGERLAAAK